MYVLQFVKNQPSCYSWSSFSSILPMLLFSFFHWSSDSAIPEQQRNYATIMVHLSNKQSNRNNLPHLRSASRRLLNIPCDWSSSFAFRVAGPLVWNLLPDYTRGESVGKDTLNFRATTSEDVSVLFVSY